MDSALLPNLLHFGRLLHAAGVDVHAGRMIDVADALQHVEIGRRSDFYFTLRSLLVHRRQDIETFDEAFSLFWRVPPGEWSLRDFLAMGEKRRFGKPQIDTTAVGESTDGAAVPLGDERLEQVVPMSYSSQEVLRTKDFAELSEAELQQARVMIAELTWNLGERRTRRWAAGGHGSLDLRKVVARTLRHAGEAFDLPRRRRTFKRRPLILLCDVSGSMERYARMLLHFIHSLAGGLSRVEAFVFATRLTHITRELAHGDRGSQRATLARQVPDWGGGTRIGDALRTFNVRWARRMTRGGPVVLLISDGWDRGDPATLAQEMSRLQRRCHRLIWLNPLLGSPDYQPLTRGMRAALPFVDDFLPVHNLVSLETLAGHLSRLPARRATRRQGPSRLARSG